MLIIRSLLVLLSAAAVHSAPQQRNRNRNGQQGTRQSPQQQAAALPQGVSQATDGSTILDTTATVNGVDLRFKVSAPANLFTTLTNVTGARARPGTTSNAGLNVLLHGDGGQSFFDFPNQAVQGGLLGVVILAPSENLLWGQRAGPPSGLSRDDGVADSLAVRDLIREVLPQVVAFDPSNVFFTGVSGGALTLSGFFMPAHLAEFPGTGVLLMCGALAPQVDVVDPEGFIANSRIHFQSTKDELVSLQQSIPEAIVAFENIATGVGLNAAQVGQLQTVDNTPNGGHCEFDELGFVSGIQLIADNFANIMQGGNGVVQGIDAPTVLTSVVGNEDLQFAAARKRELDDSLLM
ncbi:hypothetical protein QBC34DRAFT_395601 [Podospora aff. communis PSN243]|uniref:Cyclin-like f-box protein n=1 Tax=Podospora aff. communis PSN243 TaxID=3040156 RepID=A0AAV9GXL1_9PEZI|nr:hypothetical protein QBC34DRAFT_395601 [Podospora aff. communis PSN243]